MKALRRTWNRLVGSLLGHRREDDLAREMAEHIQLQTEDNMRLGMLPHAALAGIVLVVLAASLIPARRAATVDPMVAMRAD